MNKIIFLIFLTLPNVIKSRYITPSEKEINKVRINNSLVLIKGKGSGTFVNIYKNNYVLTNAHVCLAAKLDEILNNDLKNQSFTYEIGSKQYQMLVSVNQSELEYNLKEDWCLIPIKYKISHPIVRHSMITKKCRT